jgi:hypothetical protein
MKKKKYITNKKIVLYKKSASFCNHCGGALKLSQDDVSCVMCGRYANHFCDNCLNARSAIKKSA